MTHEVECRCHTCSLLLGEYKLPATGSFPAPLKIPSLRPMTGAPLSAALTWCADILAVEAEHTAEITHHTAELARHAATLGALSICCRTSWAGLFDILSYGLLSDSGTPVEPSAYIRLVDVCLLSCRDWSRDQVQARVKGRSALLSQRMGMRTRMPSLSWVAAEWISSSVVFALLCKCFVSLSECQLSNCLISGIA